MNRLLNIVKKLKFGGLKKSRLLVLHEECHDILQATVLDGLEHSVLDASAGKFYFMPAVVFLMAKNFFSKRLLNKEPVSLYVLYLLSCLEYIKPAVVITFIDNSGPFQALSRLYRGAEFYAIQNGVKTRGDVTAGAISLPNLFCFGQHEIDLYRQYGHQVDRYYPVGALIGGYYRSRVVPEGKPQYDLCLVSQWRSAVMNGTACPALKLGIDRLNGLLARYVSERGVSLCVATCFGSEEEKHFYHTAFGGRATIVDYDRLNLSTYGAMDQSRVVVTVDSCAALEAFGWGQKVLFCDYTGDRDRELALPELCLSQAPDYAEFSAKLDRLMKIEKDEYLAAAGQRMKYYMNYDLRRPAHDRIRSLIGAAGTN